MFIGSKKIWVDGWANGEWDESSPAKRMLGGKDIAVILMTYEAVAFDGNNLKWTRTSKRIA